MTRESRARWLAAATTALVVLLAALFALLRNVPAPPAPTPAAEPAAATTAPPAPVPQRPVEAPAATPVAPRSVPPPDPARVTAGERAYARLGCAMCHSIEGRGNPGSPLDGVGARLDRAALYELTTGTGAAGAQLGAGLARRKQRVLGDSELDLLIDYLAQLK